jgi:hypothetical protein
VIVVEAKPPSQHRFSLTICQLKLYVPGVVGAAIQKLKEACPPGATLLPRAMRLSP